MKSKEKSIDILPKQSIMRICNEQLYKNLLINILKSKNLNLKVPIQEQFPNHFVIKRKFFCCANLLL